MNRHCLLPVILLFVAATANGQTTLGEKTTVSFATVEQGRKVLLARDDYVKRLSPFDRAAKLETDKEVSEKQFLEFLAADVAAWNNDERKELEKLFGEIEPKLAPFKLAFPKQILLVKTRGKSEGGAAYTRGNAIVLPEDYVAFSENKLRRIVVHELFHILSRHNPKLRERLYATVGFTKCNDLEYPAEIKDQKITNPDAPLNDHYIRVKVKDRETSVVPIIFSSEEKYDADRGGPFFDYLMFGLLEVEKAADGKTLKAVYRNGKPALLDVTQVSNYFEQIGTNTGYIIHPEEVLADNFTLLILKDRRVRSQDVLDRVEEVLKAAEE